MNLYRKIFQILLILAIFNSCTKDETIPDETDPEKDNDLVSADSLAYNSDWTYLSHGKANADYNIVFPQASANKLEIAMTAAQWASIRANMKSLYGSDFGIKTGSGAPVFSDIEPDYVDVSLKFNGKLWKNVGFRLKGNSSLKDAWSQGIYKMPFKLNFDKFEDTYPGTTNQHFYGFKELSFSSGFKDQSLIREKLASDIFRLGGIPAAQTSFCRVYINFGSGSKYCGVYTIVEVPEDQMIKQQFGEEKGNIYKPESKLASFIQTEFDKKNNETEVDYSDVKSLITALNSSTRISNASQWRANLEAVFNVDHYLKFLAINNAIVNWDGYGNMAHNYYLYNHSVNKLTWIPWDHNESLSGSPGITGTTTGGSIPGGLGGRAGISLSMNEVTSSWPLIRYLADDAEYMAKYKTYMKQFKDNVFTEATMNALIDQYSTLITPYAIGSEGEQSGYTYLAGSSSFTNAILTLKNHVASRRTLISGYVP